MLNNNKQLPQAIAAIILALPLLAMAAGFQVNENSPRLQGQAMAGSGSDAGDITAIFNNPAILGSLNSNNIYLGASQINPHVSLHNAKAEHAYSNTLTPADPTTLETVHGESEQNSIAANALAPVLYANQQLGHGLVAGFALTAPWGMKTDYSDQSVVRFMALETSLKTINLSPMLAWRVNNKFSIAAGLQGQYAQADFSNYDGIPLVSKNAAWLPNLVTDYPTMVSGKGWGYGYTVGALYHPVKQTHIGISYRSQINYDLKGSTQQYTAAGGIPNQLPPNRDYPYNSNTQATASFETPAVLNLSITQQINSRWTVSSTLQETFWHALKTISIQMPEAYATETDMQLHWHDSWLAAIGADYAINKNLTLRTGLAFDQTPTSDTYRDARIPDANRTWITLGGSYQLNQHFSADIAYEYIKMANQKINVTQNVGKHNDLNPLEINTLQADFSGHANIFALGVNYNF